MVKRVVLGGLLGGLVMFVWLAVWWMFFPMMHGYFHSFEDGEAVIEVMEQQNMEPGFYYYPSEPDMNDPAAVEAYEQAMQYGPMLGPVSYHPNGTGPMWQAMVKGLVFSVVNAAIATLILLMLAPQIGVSFMRRVLIALLFGALIGIGGPMMTGNYMTHPPGYVAWEFVSIALGWLLSGLVLAWAARPIKFETS